tara:strand:+ start:602 stop:1612 length:1011 start_codon:yes stop_codon:yes gene_type:complete
MDLKNNKTSSNLDINFEENITIDNLKDFDLDAHFDSDLNLDFDLELESNNTNCDKNSNQINNSKNKKNKNNKKEEETIDENQFEDLLSGFKDKYDTNNKKISIKATQKEKEERESSFLINSVIKEHTEDINNANKINAYQYNMLLKNIQIDNKQNIKEKQLNKFQKILGIENSENYNSDNDNSDDDYLKEDKDNNCTDKKEKYNTKYLNLLIDFYLDFENCDFRNNPHLFFLVSKLDNYQLVLDTSELKNGDVIKYPVVKYINKNKDKVEIKDENEDEDEGKIKTKDEEIENTAIPDLMPVFFIKKCSNKLKVSKHNNCWSIWEDVPIFKRISNLS